MFELGKFLLIVGGVIVVLGLVLLLAGRLNLPLGRLPGDIVYRGQNSTFHFPLVSCLVISVLITLILWIINQFRR